MPSRKRSRRPGDDSAPRGGAPRERAPRPLSDAALAARSGRGVAEWFEILDAEAATRLSHDQIVNLLVEIYEAPEWGAQSVAVRYQQEHGIRLPGQQPDGTFSVTASRSIRGSQSALLELGLARVSAVAEGEPDEVHRLPENTRAVWRLAAGDVLTLVVGAPPAGAVAPRCSVTLVESGIRLPELVAGLRLRLERTVVLIAGDAA